MRKGFKETGITLISLVVTIIILLILAGVTIGVATNGTGLFEKAKLATDEYNNSVEKENIDIQTYSNNIESAINGNRDTVTLTSEQYQDLVDKTTWKLHISEAGHYSDATAITLPTKYSELLINVGLYNFHIIPEMLKDDSYSDFRLGFGYGSNQNLCDVFATKTKLYIEHNSWSSNTSSSSVVTVYYK